MGIIAIKRDYGVQPSLVRIMTTDDLATVNLAGYITSQYANIVAINEGEFDWNVTDMALIYASDGAQICQVNASSTSFIGIATGTGGSSIYLPKSGGTMTGGIKYAGVPSSNPDTSTLRSEFLQVPVSVSSTPISRISTNTVWIVPTATWDVNDPVGLASNQYDPGYNFTIKNTSAGNVTFTPFGAETVDGVPGAFTIAAGTAVTFMAQGLPTPTAWLVTANYSLGGGGVTSTQVQRSSFTTSSDSGTLNNYVGIYNPVISSYGGSPLLVINALLHTNTGATTFNAGGGAIAIVTPDLNPLVGGEMLINQAYYVLYNGTLNKWILLNSSLNVTPAEVQKFVFSVTTDTGSVNSYTGSFNPPVGTWTSAYNGVPFSIRALSATNTGAATFNFLPIVTPNLSALVGGEMLIGNTYFLMFNSNITSFVLLNSSLGGAGVTAAQVQSGQFITATDSGSSTNYVGATTPTIASYSVGMQIALIPANTNTDNSPNFRLGALANWPIVLNNNFDNIAIGDIVGGRVALLEYALGGVWVLLNPATFTQPKVISGRYTAYQDSGSVNAYSASSVDYPNLSQYPGQLIVLRNPSATNTGTSTMSFGGGTPRVIHYQGNPLVGGEIVAGVNAVLSLDESGVVWELINSQLVSGGASASQVQTNAFNLVSDTTNTDNYVATASPVPTLFRGLTVFLNINHSNTTTSPTFNLSGTGVKSVAYPKNVPINIGDMNQNSTCTLVYDDGYDIWQLMNGANPMAIVESMLSGNAYNLIVYTATGSVNTPAITQALTSLTYQRTPVWFIPNHTNTGAMTLSYNGTPRTISDLYGNALIGGETVANFPAQVIFNGNSGQWMLQNSQLFNVLGTNTNNSAATGYVGEYVSSTVAIGSAVGLTSGAGANITSISLTAGDWDVDCNVGFLPANTTIVTYMAGSISTTSATIAADALRGTIGLLTITGNGTNPMTVHPAKQRISIASTTTVYLVAYSNFTVSTNAAYGVISARRVR